MGIDLNALAAQLADQLATAPYATREGEGTAQQRVPEESVLAPAAVEPPRGVRFCAEHARVGDYVDHTLLRPDATRAEIERLCAEALEHRFAAVCVNPAWVPACAQLLAGGEVQLATVVGFPLGATASAIKAAEAALAVREGAQELDMVVALGALRAGAWGEVERDIAAVVEAAEGALVKVILESAVLAPLEIVRACHAARDAGADYVKTSTGFHAAGGATAAAVALMRMAVGDTMGVKASGGVRDGATALAMFAAGATRIGTSAGVAMADDRGPGPRPIGALLGGVAASAAAVQPVY
ncbi:MAG TPA: deoxyribose-phosphate aldolase [Gemmatimonadaceae bacterium]|nr:deoxyribose-phosphate aldolase [Gemmatimonadaceae bacterium]